MPLSSRNTIRHASIFVLVLLVSCVIAQNGSPTLFGLHNNISNSQTASNAMNAWMQGPHTKDMQSFIGVQAVSFYLFTQSAELQQQRLSQQLEAIWNNGSIPLLQLLPSYDPITSVAEFDAYMQAASPYYNDATVANKSTGAFMTSLACSVILPYLFPSVSSSSTTSTSNFSQWCDGATINDMIVDATSGGVEFPSRRLYLEFAPFFTSCSFLWSSEYTGNTSVVDSIDHDGAGLRTAASVSQQAPVLENDPTSYRNLWRIVMGELLLAPLQDFLFTQGAIAAAAVRLGSVSRNATMFEQLRVSRFVQSIWTASATQLTSSWTDDDSSDWGSLLSSWLPRWGCLLNTSTNGDLVDEVLCSTSTTQQCGPDWLGLTGVIQNTTLDVAPSDLVTPMLDALKYISHSIEHGDLPLCRAPELDQQPAPIAIVHFGASADVPLQGGAQRKDHWIHDMIQFAFEDDNVLMAVPLNVEYYEWVMGAPTSKVYMEIYSFDAGSLCCDGKDPSSGAAILTQVSAALMDAISARLVVPVAAPPPVVVGTCMACRIVSDAVFLGSNNGSNTTAGVCVCPASAATTPAATPWYKRVFEDAIVLSCFCVVLIVIVLLLVWKLRKRTVRQVRRKMILGRYIVHRVIHHCRAFSSVLMAHDAKHPGSSVIIKQYVLNSDTVIAVANNEIEKSRACTGYPHLAQVIQCTFAWKQPRRRPGINDERRQDSANDHRNGGAALHARFLPDTSSSSLNNAEAPNVSNVHSSSKQPDSRNVVMNDKNAAKIPFAILVLRHYSLGDLKSYVHHMIEMTGGDRALDAHSGVLYSDAVSILTQLCLAVHTIHCVVRPEDPMIHRDIKPENVFLERRPLRGKPTEFVILAYLGDFGCALFSSQFAANPNNGEAQKSTGPQMGHSSFLTGKAVGTSTYMSLDAREGKYSTSSDVWALGCVMMFLVLRRCPDDVHHAMKEEEFIRSVRSTMSKDALFPGWLCDLILMKMLHHDPTRRPSANEILSLIRKNASASPAVDAALRGKKMDDIYGSPSRVELFDESTDAADTRSSHASRREIEISDDDPDEEVVGLLDSDDPQTILDDEDIAATSDHFQLEIK